jgi:hypothetical protein
MIFLLRKWNSDMEGKKSKRGRVGEGRPSKRTPELVARIAEAVAIGLTDREAGPDFRRSLVDLFANPNR